MNSRHPGKESLSIILPAMLGVLLFVTAIFGYIIPSYRQQLLEQKKETLQELIRLGLSELSLHYHLERQGIMDRETAQHQAREHLRHLRFGPEHRDYFWINDLGPSMIMHPYLPDLEGQDLTDYKDPQGRTLFMDMVAKVEREGEGFVPYQWQRHDDPNRVTDKLSFVSLFKPWGWIVGTGIYIEGVEHEIAVLTRGMTVFSILATLVILGVALLMVHQSLRAIKQRQEAETAMRREQDKARRYFEASDVIMADLDLGGRIESINPAGLGILGYRRDELLGRDWFDVCVPERYRDRAREFFIQVIKSGAPLDKHVEAPLLTRSGEERLIRWHTVLILDNDGRGAGVLSSGEDVTALRHAHEEMIRLAEAIRQSAEAVVMMDKTRVISWVNPAFERIFGYKNGEVIGRPPDSLLLEPPADGENIWSGVESGQVWTGLTRARKKDGDACTVEIVLTTIKDASNQVINYLAMVRDVTREKQLEEQLGQVHKMEAIGTLAGGIAHDFNNILSSIIGYTELARRAIDPHGHPHQDLDQVMKAARRAKDLVQQILTFSRRGEQEWHVLSLTPLIKETMAFLRSTLPSSITMQTHFNTDNDTVRCDPTRMQQVLMNLCTNAAQAMKDRSGIMDISLDRVFLDDTTSPPVSNLDHGHYLRLCVSDTGHGMSSEIMARVFDPFFTTKGRGEGTGMGLAVVHGIVRSHGGTVTVESHPDEGSTFCVYLPRHDGTAVATARDDQSPMVSGGGERILLVDDEPMLIELWQRSLYRIGYLVTAFESSAQALVIFQNNPADFDLLITDQTMPEMSGISLAEKIRAIRADLPIMLCTGAPDERLMDAVRALNIQALLKKPFTISKLATAVRHILDGLDLQD
jgi:PAS domain S-box-containing protein